MENDITLRIHPIAGLDHLSQGTRYSSRAAGAMYCVASTEPNVALDFYKLLFQEQPAENTQGFSNDQLIKLARQIGAESAAECIADGTYAEYAQEQLENMPPDPATGKLGTPTVVVDGAVVSKDDVAARLDDILG